MFRTVCLLFICISIAACAKDEETSTQPAAAAQRIPEECTYQVTAAHTFIDGYTFNADRYDCALQSRMSCKLYDAGDDQIELLCEEINPALPQGVPSGCTYQGGSSTSTVHWFIGYGLLYSEAYTCGSIGDGLACTYFTHPGNQCSDTNGTAADDCGLYEDDEVHEEIRCSKF